MMHEQLYKELGTVLQERFGNLFRQRDISKLVSFTTYCTEKLYECEYHLHENSIVHGVKNLISSVISDFAMKNDCTVFHQNASIRLVKKIEA